MTEALSEVTAGRTAHGRFLFEMSVELYEEYGFSRIRQIGKHRWIVRRDIHEDGGALRPELARPDRDKEHR